MLDLDRFKYINDTAGHPVGDSLLVEVSRRLRAHLGEGPVLARLGGDEFAMILSQNDTAGLERLSHGLRQLQTADRNAVFNPMLECIRDQVLDSGLDLTCLVFEITETCAILNLSAARSFIDALRVHGVRFALDDFGTGFCSLSHLKQLPVDIVKFDGQFVRELHLDETDRAMVSAMNDIVHAMALILSPSPWA